MDKRYQIFISSTFMDLQDERARVQNMIMQLGYIPAGMELFPAIDEEQLDFIKKIIDDSDYYLLIIAGRYGSVAKDGISYTEKEYDYAVSKGMKVIALVHGSPRDISLEKSEKDAKSRKSLDKFRKKVMQGRIVLFWKDASELPGKLAQSLPITIKTYPAVGWVRADSVPGPETYRELNDLRKENEYLKSLTKSNDIQLINIEGLNDWTVLTLEFRLKLTINGVTSYQNGERPIHIKWGDLFDMVAPWVFMSASERDIRDNLAMHFLNATIGSEFYNPNAEQETQPMHFSITNEDINKIRIQFRALDLITLTAIANPEFSSHLYKERVLLWGLTPEGEKLLIINKAIRRV